MSQRRRLGVLAVELSLLLVVTLVSTGRLVGELGGDGLWFYSALLALLLADLIVEPWYTRPADALANGAAAFIAVVTASYADFGSISEQAFDAGRYSLLGYLIAVMGVVTIAMVSRPQRGFAASNIHTASYQAAGTLGRARTVFTVLFAASAAATFANDVLTLLVLYLFVVLVVLEQLPGRLLQRTQTNKPAPEAMSVVRRVIEPSAAVLLVPAATQVGDLLVVNDNVVGRITHRWATDEGTLAETRLDPGVSVLEGDVVTVRSAEATEKIAGTVAPGTSLDRLILRTSAAQADLVGVEEGSLLETSVRGSPVLYQVVGAEISTGTPQMPSESMKLVLTGRKLGAWDVDTRSFRTVPWTPAPGQLVHVLAHEETSADPAYIGQVPGSPYGVAYDVREGVTHNTAVLGILGSGKTRVAADLAWRAVGKGAQVVVLDITDQWATLFDELGAAAVQEEFHRNVADKIAARQSEARADGEHAGNLARFRTVVKEELRTFLRSPHPVLICNPTRWVVTQELGFLRGGAAEVLRSLTPAETTACIAAALLELVSDEERDDARVCLVLEEAHSLAPEWNAVAHEKEKQATIATSRAILQGRKFGLGCIVVTQRTANVTKTVLNQCNTIVALRVYDQTGAEFLSHFIGSDYSSLLATLPERIAIVFGRGSSCQSPVLIRVNDWSVAAQLRGQIATEVQMRREDTTPAPGEPAAET